MKQSKKVPKSQEMKVYGKRAALGLFEKRPEDIIRAYVTKDGLFTFKPIVKYCADKKLAYHVVEAEEIESIAKSNHHEGVVLLVKTKKLPVLTEMFSQKGRSLILALEEVENPHNLGAILRSAAHFGVTGIVYLAKVPVAQTSAAYRTAEGGAESVAALHIQDWKEVQELAKKNKYQIFTTSSHGGKSLYQVKFPEKALLFLGAEGAGLSEKLLALGEKIQIPGTGEVESLNVSNAATVVLSEWFRQGT
jgi:RNA methyltransferase, TrmH family